MRLRLVATVATLALASSLVVAPTGSSASFDHRVNSAACSNHVPARLAVPEGFALEVCFDGTRLTLRNPHGLVIKVTVEGDLNPTNRRPDSISITELVADSIAPGNSVLPPGFTSQIVVGPGSGHVRVALDTTGNASYYFATRVAAVLGFTPFGIYDSLLDLIEGLQGTNAEFQSCWARNGFFGRMTCSATAASKTIFYLNVFGADLIPGPVGLVIDTVMAIGDSIALAYDAIASSVTWKNAAKTMDVSATQVTATTKVAATLVLNAPTNLAFVIRGACTKSPTNCPVALKWLDNSVGENGYLAKVDSEAQGSFEVTEPGRAGSTSAESASVSTAVGYRFCVVLYAVYGDSRSAPSKRLCARITDDLKIKVVP